MCPIGLAYGFALSRVGPAEFHSEVCLANLDFSEPSMSGISAEFHKERISSIHLRFQKLLPNLRNDTSIYDTCPKNSFVNGAPGALNFSSNCLWRYHIIMSHSPAPSFMLTTIGCKIAIGPTSEYAKTLTTRPKRLTNSQKLQMTDTFNG